MTYFATYFLGAPAASFSFLPPGDPEPDLSDIMFLKRKKLINFIY